MKKLLVLLGIVAVVGYVTNADAADRWPRWYVGLTGSVGFALDDDFSGDFEYEDGYGLGGSIGYLPKFGLGALDNFRIEAEYFYRENRYEGSAVDIETSSYMGNVYYDFGRLEAFPLIPYVGGGLGITDIDAGGATEDDAFTWQLMGGLNFEFEEVPMVVFGVGYRYVRWDDNDITDEASNHNIEAGVRLRF